MAEGKFGRTPQPGNAGMMRFRQGGPPPVRQQQQQQVFQAPNSGGKVDFSKKSKDFSGVPPPLAFSELSVGTESPSDVSSSQLEHELVGMYGGGNNFGDGGGGGGGAFRGVYKQHGITDDVRAGSGMLLSGRAVDDALPYKPNNMQQQSGSKRKKSSHNIKIDLSGGKSLHRYKINLQQSKERAWEEAHPLNLETLRPSSGGQQQQQQQQAAQKQLQQQLHQVPQQQLQEAAQQLLGMRKMIPGNASSSHVGSRTIDDKSDLDGVVWDESTIEDALREELEERARARRAVTHHDKGNNNIHQHHRFREQFRQGQHRREEPAGNKKRTVAAPKSVAHSDGKGQVPEYDNKRPAFKRTSTKLLPLAWHGWVERARDLKRHNSHH